MTTDSSCRVISALFVSLLAGCATQAPIAELDAARHCIETADANGAEGEPAGELLTGAKAYARGARRTSDPQQAEHYAHLALQGCRTAAALARARQIEQRIGVLETTRVHLQTGLRAIQAETAARQERELASRLGIEEGNFTIEVEPEMFGRGGEGLQPRARPLIAEVAEFLHEHRRWHLAVAGASSPHGRRAAESVRHSLVARGLAPERILVSKRPSKGFVELSIFRPK